jgi:hypothetical protein
MRWSIGNLRSGTNIREAQLMLSIFKPYIDRMHYNFSATQEQNRLLWNYYQLRENFQSKDFWKKDTTGISTNEAAVEVLVEYYLRMRNELEISLNIQENALLDKIITRFYEHLNLINTAQRKNASRSDIEHGSLGMEASS